MILSTLIENSAKPYSQKNVDYINGHYRDIVKRRSQDNQRIVLAEMAGVLSPDQINVKDHTHPTDMGYVIMAQTWLKSFREADSKGFFNAPRFNWDNQWSALCSPCAG